MNDHFVEALLFMALAAAAFLVWWIFAEPWGDEDDSTDG